MKTQELHLPSLGQSLRRSPIMHGITFPRSRVDRMRTALQASAREQHIPGFVLGIRQGSREYVEASGALAFDGARAMQRDAIFRLASTTKPITAIAAMMLVEECRMRLDDPVDTWLPELKDRKVLRTIASALDDTVPAKRRITVRDLLTFRSGYGEVLFDSPACPMQKAMAEKELPLACWPFRGTQDELMERLGALPLVHQPGERWLYHMSAEILGVLISRVTGQALRTFLRERIFVPLGMNDTDFDVPESKIDRLPTCYGSLPPRTELVVLDTPRAGLYAKPPKFESGAGGLVSTVDDLLALGEMMLNGGALGRERILSRASVELMTMDHLTAAQKASSPFFEGFWDSRGWGLGMSVVTRRQDVGEVPGRYGWDGAFGTSWYVDPKEKLIGVMLTQRRPDVPAMPVVVRDFWNLTYQLIDD